MKTFLSFPTRKVLCERRIQSTLCAAFVLMASWRAGAQPAAQIVGDAPATNFVLNGGFESKDNLRPYAGDRAPATWTLYGKSAQVIAGGKTGKQALRIERAATAPADQMDGAAYVIEWKQSWQWPVTISASSKAEAATGKGGAANPGDYAIYCDVNYDDGSSLFGRIAPFRPGTHDWEDAELTIMPEKPLKRIHLYLLFRGGWQGRVWFDDVSARAATPDELRARSMRGRPNAPKLIEFGWDSINHVSTAFVRDNWRLMDEQPFDGIVMPLAKDTYLFDADRQDDKTYEQARADFKSVQTRKLKHNFAVLHANPGTVDFFDAEWDNILASTGALARAARDVKFAGICFDPEAYVEPHAVFSFAHQKHRDKYSYEQYRQKARERGRQWMSALQQNFPGLTIFALFGPSANWNYTREADWKRALEGAPWGLYAPFMDGMLDVMAPDVKFVDACEWGYYMTDRTAFLDAFRRIKSECQIFFSPENRAKYRAQVQVGFGLYLDYGWSSPGKGWHTDDPSKNMYPPAKFGENAKNALEVSEEYVWVYSEGKRNWWNPQNSDIPRAYSDALEAARWMP